ncbi:glutamate 5-kinase [Clostridium acetobutylicum]|uniref:Glutamate 5-kinase n=1 Tax=Clostridium acetobutylicum (strain ATCC 824 / DSM 792 / JCM 1419 / IAM 19013 / LMG 5710 / NBRC 13948 / NRRL B-527 / VKM B-1787 / 2291 / W) TaxID=272562 RepID=PROB_CLOAB|nr:MULTISPECIES: glutamate 5-kinase [Clostridium]Q97E63.1 RecName: Full=Glutamate 5-kinase; AltName: Full=Gamma-glutamyl kinase; Short=GK [Clostridium acetobutylicum ATCC 824]AAK81187.1 ProB [Clostridium acetobutylicum ATCC 824]ADZ22293.1 gamma-glutamyl kinase [Clostridium acetobutylicum EA 2018]AEI33764.1 gamma-glutamyl kinase [Clostridium acetobutylicum DSM 1731]AWV81143.1 glutamate 5-kinase [Clostridium acetobutylicum]MBC2395655.1 glutamate 5-kinase [Clostridium acetobutylicum]
MNTREKYLSNVNRLVIKVGSSTLTHPSGLLNFYKIEHIVRQIADLHNQGIKVILVSSGAIGAGIGKLRLKERPKTIPEKQAAAAVGQGVLMHTYEKLFAEYGQIVGQILITREDLSSKKRVVNVQNTFSALLDHGIIPIVNENDATVVEEIKFGDNDTLSARVASLIKADLLILLSDIDGLYDSNPAVNKNAVLIDTVNEVNEEVKASAGGAGSKLGTGGMATKIRAAEIATENGISMVIANGEKQEAIRNILNFENEGTLFIPKNK